ncbi:hypothetical protein AVEN_80431-1 [Araneus ventricosus]|uniref:Uncharacterized protein n=1 Tax=Araneus ventricosus TaxID=182803 RepID=A0A4Y2H5K8_ARAVE|nr:hypothetical protein AVEN_80431-1 [Araneus ventricosus]
MKTHLCLRRHGQEDIRVNNGSSVLGPGNPLCPPEHSSYYAYPVGVQLGVTAEEELCGSVFSEELPPKPHVQCLGNFGAIGISLRKKKRFVEDQSCLTVVIYSTPAITFPSGARKWAVVGEDNTAHYPLVISETRLPLKEANRPRPAFVAVSIRPHERFRESLLEGQPHKNYRQYAEEAGVATRVTFAPFSSFLWVHSPQNDALWSIFQAREINRLAAYGGFRWYFHVFQCRSIK